MKNLSTHIPRGIKFAMVSQHEKSSQLNERPEEELLPHLDK